MDLRLAVGVLGGFLIVAGAAWPIVKVSHPVKSVKNWLYFVGGVLLLWYAWLGYLAGGPVFYVFFEIFLNIVGVLMLAGLEKKKWGSWLVGLCGAVFLIWSLLLFEDYTTGVFVVGLTVVGVAYVLKGGTALRNFTLAVGALLIALFSYFVGDAVFLWLNLLTAGFAGWHGWRLRN